MNAPPVSRERAAASVEQGDVVDIVLDHIELVGAHEDRGATGRPLAQHTHEATLHQGVEPDERLVENVDVGVESEGAGKHKALLLPAGELLGVARRFVREPHGIERLVGGAAGRAARQPTKPRAKEHVVMDT